MNVNDMKDSKYLKAADLKGRDVLVTIDRLEPQKMNDGKMKWVMYFRGKEKGFVLNIVNINNIAHIYGDETDEWGGKQITLFPTMVDFQGRSVEAIRVKGPKRQDPISSGLEDTF